jgi:phage terminase large subunit-like protein
MQHPAIGHDDAKTAVTFREIRSEQATDSIRGNQFHAWAVRSGDVAAPIPEPETYAMLLAGLGLLGFMARRKRTA